MIHLFMTKSKDMKIFTMVALAMSMGMTVTMSAQDSTTGNFVIDGVEYNPFRGTDVVVVGYTADLPSTVVIGEGVRYDGRNYRIRGVNAGAFEGCTAMKALVFSAPNEQTAAMPFSIGDKAFDTPSLMEIVMMRPVLPQVSGDPFSAETYANATLKVSDAMTEAQQEAYRTTAPWNAFFESDHGLVTGLQTVDGDAAAMCLSGCNGWLHVDNAAGEKMDVYSLSGCMVYSGEPRDLRLSAGVYMVRVGDVVAKVAL